jgi:hypothetical protein
MYVFARPEWLMVLSVDSVLLIDVRTHAHTSGHPYSGTVINTNETHAPRGTRYANYNVKLATRVQASLNR